MNTLRLPILALTGSLVINIGCQKKEAAPCGPVQVATTEMAGWNYSPACFAAPLAIGQSISSVVNSYAELQQLNQCPGVPAIDFNRYTLLVGKTRTASCSSVDAQSVTQNCDSYTYRVKLVAGLCQASTEVMYGVLVPKLPAGTAVAFDVR